MNSETYAGLDNDTLDRIVTLGVHKSASALSKMLGQEVYVSVTECRLFPVWEVSQTLGEPDKGVVGISFKLLGELEGHLSLIFERPQAFTLVDLLLGQSQGTPQEMDETGQSALKEMGNILANSYLTVLGHETKMMVMASAPELVEAPLGNVLESLMLEASEITVGERALLVRNDFQNSALTLQGSLVLFLKKASLEHFFTKVSGYDEHLQSISK